MGQKKLQGENGTTLKSEQAIGTDQFEIWRMNIPGGRCWVRENDLS